MACGKETTCQQCKILLPGLLQAFQNLRAGQKKQRFHSSTSTCSGSLKELKTEISRRNISLKMKYMKSLEMRWNSATSLWSNPRLEVKSAEDVQEYPKFHLLKHNSDRLDRIKMSFLEETRSMDLKKTPPATFRYFVWRDTDLGILSFEMHLSGWHQLIWGEQLELTVSTPCLLQIFRDAVWLCKRPCSGCFQGQWHHWLLQERRGSQISQISTFWRIRSQLRRGAKPCNGTDS